MTDLPDKPKEEAKPETVAGVAGTKSYRYIGDHPQEFNVGDKVNLLAPGEFVTLSTDDLEVHKEWVDQGLLIEAEGKK